jgi:hypothetical protein
MKLSGAALVLLSLSSRVSGSNQALRNNEEVSTPSLPAVGSVIEGSYIVRMDPTSTGANSAMNSLATSLGASSRDVFSKTILGFSVKNIDATMAEEIAQMEAVASVVPDTVVAYEMLAGSEQSVDPQLLDRFTREEQVPYGVARVNGGSFYRGDNVAFVVDTGIFNHDDLNVDYRRGYTVDASAGMTDDHGHGTQYVHDFITQRNLNSGISLLIPLFLFYVVSFIVLLGRLLPNETAKGFEGLLPVPPSFRSEFLMRWVEVVHQA